MSYRSSPHRVLAIIAAAVLIAVPAISATFVVTVESDGNDGTCDSHCTLREAVLAANDALGGDMVVLQPGTYLITLEGAGENSAAFGDLDVTDPLVVLGAGARHTVIDGGGLDRVFDVRPAGELELERVTVRNGFVSGGGGGISAIGPLTLTACAVVDNRTVDFGFGGGISSTSVGGVLEIRRSTISGNTADGGGGGLVAGGTAMLADVTIAGNQSAADLGGGVYAFSGASIDLVGCTVVGNSSTFGGGVVAEGGSFFAVSNTVVAQNSAPTRPDCSGTFFSLGHNLVGDGSTCSGFGTQGDLVGSAASPVDPQLHELGPSGGETDTYEPSAGSPVIDAGSPLEPGTGAGTCSLSDQRLVSRPIDGDGSAGAVCDIGAHESGGLFFGGFDSADTNRWSATTGAASPQASPE